MLLEDRIRLILATFDHRNNQLILEQMKFKLLLTLFIIGIFSTLSFSQNYLPIEKASSIRFFINNFGISTEGSFGGLRGDIYFNPYNLESSSFEISLEAETVYTKNRTRDTHLKSKDFFYVEKYPTIYLISKSITRTGQEGLFWFQGNLIIKGVTREIKFQFSAEKERSGYLFKGNFSLNRRDFLIGSGSLVLSNNVQVAIAVSTMKI